MRNLIASLLFSLVAVLTLPGASLAQAPAPDAAAPAQSQPAAPIATSDASYVLGPQDVIEVSVLGRSDFTTRAKVGEDGLIQLPFLGTITAAKKTTSQLGAEVADALEKGGYFSKPILRVEIVAYASRYVTVLGAVTTPGLIPVDRPYHLSEILARVGGARPDAADYLIVRPDNGPEHRFSISGLVTGDASQDPTVSPGDKILVPKAELFYISGQVKGPGAFALETDMTLRMAIARGGGLTDLGTDHGVKVTGVDGKVRRLQLDDKIKPGDVIVVGERLF